MYRYDAYDHALVQARVVEFRDQVARWKAGLLTDDEFRPLRLRNGLYVQRHAPMFRISIPYGLLSSRQLRTLAGITRDFDKGYGHFTTRQDIQLNWIAIEDVPDALQRLADVEMHGIQTSGDCVRNITTDPYAGVAVDEGIDPRPYAEILRQWSAFHPEFSWLPRKFKIALSGSESDRALTWFHDIGLQLAVDAAGETTVRVLAGGGLGRTPIRGEVIRENLHWTHLLTYCEAILRIYNLHGRRDNPYKARIKILVQALGREEFARQVDAEWEHLRGGPATLTEAEFRRVAAHFAPPAYAPRNAAEPAVDALRSSSKAFDAWFRRAVKPERTPGYAAVTLSLKKHGEAPGDITAAQLDLVADWADRHAFGEVRVTHEQNLVIPDVALGEIPALWEAARAAGLATPNTGLLTDMICCPGGDFCDLANAKSLPIAKAIQERFDDLDYLFDLGDIELNISGCINACGHHHVGHIGVLGVDKGDKEFYQVTLGGRQGNDARLGKVIGPAFAAADMPELVARLIGVYLAHRHPDERFIDTLDRIGVEPFKDAAYEGHPKRKAGRTEEAQAG